MIVRRHAPGYNFVGDTENGVTMRWGTSANVNPLRAPWPELVDISISNHCSKNCGFCYRDSAPDGSFMTLEQYEFMLERLNNRRWGTVFQVALGGGEPLEHPEFVSIIRRTRAAGIIPNFTTNGEYIDRSMVDAIRGYVGAVAVSVSRMDGLDTMGIGLLANAGIRTNIHYIIDDRSIGEASDILKGRFNDMLVGVNGVVFLTYKPAGRGSEERCLTMDSRLERFVSLTGSEACVSRVGFDACFVPLLLSRGAVNPDYVDSCECGFFSVYIDEKLNVKPCSFAPDGGHSYSLLEHDLEEIWENRLDSYRNETLAHPCRSSNCGHMSDCRGRCVFFNCLSFCHCA